MNLQMIINKKYWNQSGWIIFIAEVLKSVNKIFQEYFLEDPVFKLVANQFFNFKYSFCKQKYTHKNANYKFKLIKKYLLVTCRKSKNVCHQAPLNININVHVKKQRKENLMHAFTVYPLTHNTYKKVLPTQTNAARKICRFIFLCKNPHNTPYTD